MVNSKVKGLKKECTKYARGVERLNAFTLKYLGHISSELAAGAIQSIAAANEKENLMGKAKVYSTSFKYRHGEVLYQKSDKNHIFPLTVIMQQLRVMTDGTGTNWYLCRFGAGNVHDAYVEMELCRG